MEQDGRQRGVAGRTGSSLFQMALPTNSAGVGVAGYLCGGLIEAAAAEPAGILGGVCFWRAAEPGVSGGSSGFRLRFLDADGVGELMAVKVAAGDEGGEWASSKAGALRLLPLLPAAAAAAVSGWSSGETPGRVPSDLLSAVTHGRFRLGTGAAGSEAALLAARASIAL